MSMKNGGPAFPLPLGTANCAEPEQSGGMTLRDYFAAKAMQGDFAAQNEHCGMFVPDAGDTLFDRSARMYYRMADAMLKVREVKP